MQTAKYLSKASMYMRTSQSMRFFSTNPHVYFNIARNGQPLGKITFELYADKVPKTAENFRSICAGDNKQGYTYAKSMFHRVIPDFMAQGGDFTNHNGTGGLSIYGAKFADEAAGLRIKHDKRGQLSMANAGPNTNGSQFFITFVPCDWLNGAHVVFGHMTEGDDVLRQIEMAGSRSGATSSKITIESCGEVKQEEEK